MQLQQQPMASIKGLSEFTGLYQAERSWMPCWYIYSFQISTHISEVSEVKKNQDFWKEINSKKLFIL